MLAEDDVVSIQNGTGLPWENEWWWPEDDRVFVLVGVIVFIVFVGGVGFHMATQANFMVEGGEQTEQGDAQEMQ